MDKCALANKCIKLTKSICKSSKGFKLSIRFDNFHFLSTSFPEQSLISSEQTKGNSRKRKTPSAIKRGIDRKKAYLLKKKVSSPTNDVPTNEVLDKDVISEGFQGCPFGKIIQLDGAENLIEYNIPITDN